MILFSTWSRGESANILWLVLLVLTALLFPDTQITNRPNSHSSPSSPRLQVDIVSPLPDLTEINWHCLMVQWSWEHSSIRSGNVHTSR